MGKKMSLETVEKIAKMSCKHDSIFISGNKYGYKVDINHPLIRPMYDRFKDTVGSKILSDKERFQFEALILQKFRKEVKK